MFRFGGLVAALLGQALAFSPIGQDIMAPTLEAPARPSRKKRVRTASLSPEKLRRSRGPGAKPKRRSNRLHVARRARRRNRRKAA